MSNVPSLAETGQTILKLLSEIQLMYKLLVALPLAFMEGRGNSENSLKPPKDVYKGFLTSIAQSDQEFLRSLALDKKSYYFKAVQLKIF